MGVGLDEIAVRDVLNSEKYADAVRQDVPDGQALGLRGVAFLVIDRAFGISGAQSPEVFTDALNQASAHTTG